MEYKFGINYERSYSSVCMKETDDPQHVASKKYATRAYGHDIRGDGMTLLVRKHENAQVQSFPPQLNYPLRVNHRRILRRSTLASIETQKQKHGRPRCPRNLNRVEVPPIDQVNRSRQR